MKTEKYSEHWHIEEFLQQQVEKEACQWCKHPREKMMPKTRLCSHCNRLKLKLKRIEAQAERVLKRRGGLPFPIDFELRIQREMVESAKVEGRIYGDAAAKVIMPLTLEHEYVTGRYDPSTDTWRPLSTAGTPAPAEGIKAIWTGHEMLVWGGRFFASRYDPATDSWRPMSTMNMPSSLQNGAEVVIWTGTEMIAWDNRSDNTGAKYDPAKDTWTPMSKVGAPSGGDYVGAWTGQQLIVLGTAVPIKANPSQAAGIYCDLVGFVPPCAYSLSATTTAVSAKGIQASPIFVTCDPTCSWSATSNNHPWLSIVGIGEGIGSGQFAYAVATNPDTNSRVGTITVRDKNLTVRQSGAPGVMQVSASGKNLIIVGVNFDSQAIVLVDGTPRRTLHDDQDPRMLIGKKVMKGIASGTSMSVQVQNGDGALSQAFSFVRP